MRATSTELSLVGVGVGVDVDADADAVHSSRRGGRPLGAWDLPARMACPGSHAAIEIEY